MIGFLVHLAKPWHGIRHLLICAVDVWDLLEQALEMEPFQARGQYQNSRVVKAIVHEHHWEEFHRLGAAGCCNQCRTKQPAA